MDTSLDLCFFGDDVVMLASLSQDQEYGGVVLFLSEEKMEHVIDMQSC